MGPFSGRQLLVVLLTAASAALVLAVLTTPIHAPPPRPIAPAASGFQQVAPPTEGLRIGDRAPELAGVVDGRTVQLTDLDGRPVRLADLRGRPVWINFWASWCAPCQAETPTLARVYETHRAQGLQLLGISVQETTPDDVRAYVRTYGLEYLVGFDATSAVFKTYRAFALPTQIFLDRTGVIRDIRLGPVTEAEAERILAPLLAQAGP